MSAHPDPIPTPDGPLPRLLEALFDDPWSAVAEWFAWGPGAVRTAIVVVCAGVLLAAAVMLLGVWRDARMRGSARRIRILPPPEVSGAPGPEMLWMSLHSLLRPWWRRALVGQPYLSWEIVARPDEVQVGVWVPRHVPPGLVERAIDAAWPGARAEEVSEDPLAWAPPAEADGPRIQVAELGLADDQRYPIGRPGPGALGLVLAGLTGMVDGEAAAIQVVARPATSSARGRLVRAAWKLKVGTRRARRGAGGVHGRFLNPALERDVSGVLEKAAAPLWRCRVRVAVSSPTRQAARGRIHALAGAFGVFEGRNGFRRRRAPRGRARLRARRLSRAYLLSVPELAQAATLPMEGAVAGLERAGARTVAPPRILPTEGKVLGTADHPGMARSVAISTEDARHHLHVLGETGTGKSTLVANMVLEDAAAGRSAVVIDPKGDLVEAILERLPAGAEDRTCLIDPDDASSAVGLNVLGGEDPDLTVEHVLAVFRRIFEPWWGPRTDHIMRGACLTLTRIPGATLVEVPLLLTSFGWRREVRERLHDSAGVSAFWQWYERTPEGQRANHIAPLLNKLGGFVLRAPVQAMVGQPRSKLDIPGLLDSGGLLLARIPKGTLGDETSRLLGALVVTRVWQACMRRARLPEARRPDTTLYVDEMHNYLALPKSFEDLLAEARGYRLSLVLAHQHLGQLPGDMREALGANARTKVVFTCSPDDAVALERHFSPQLGAHDLSHLRAFQAACRPCVEGGHGPAFTFATQPLGPPGRSRAAAVRRASRAAFGRNRARVAAAVNERHERIEDGDYHLLPAEDGPRNGSEGGPR